MTFWKVGYASEEKCASGSGKIITFKTMFASHSKAEKLQVFNQ